MTVPFVVAMAAGVLILGFGAIVVLALYSSVRGQTSARAGVALVDTDSHPLGSKLLDAALDADGWASAHELGWSGLYQFTAPGNPPAFLAVWSPEGRNEYLVVFMTLTPGDVVRARWLEFVSLFDRDRSLSTSNTAGTMLFPRWPGQYKQAFPRLTIDELEARHHEGVVFLRAHAGVRDRGDRRPIEEILIESVRRSAEHVRGHGLWAIRGVWWWASQSSRAHRSVAEQVARREA